MNFLRIIVLSYYRAAAKEISTVGRAISPSNISVIFHTSPPGLEGTPS